MSLNRFTVLWYPCLFSNFLLLGYYEKPRKCVFKDGYKLSVEGATGKVEEFTLNGKGIDQKENADKFKDLINELEIFKGKENFKLPA